MEKNKNKTKKQDWLNCFVWLLMFIGCVYFWGRVIELIGDLFIYLS